MNPTSPLYMNWFGRDKAEVYMGCVLSGVDSNTEKTEMLWVQGSTGGAKRKWGCSLSFLEVEHLLATVTGSIVIMICFEESEALGVLLTFAIKAVGDYYLNWFLKLNIWCWAEPQNARNWLHTVWILEWTQRSIWYDSTRYRNWPHVIRYSSFGFSKAIAIFWRKVGPSITVKLQPLCSS